MTTYQKWRELREKIYELDRQEKELQRQLGEEVRKLLGFDDRASINWFHFTSLYIKQSRALQTKQSLEIAFVADDISVHITYNKKEYTEERAERDKEGLKNLLGAKEIKPLRSYLD
ncbi:hypothetical protein [Campylobacter curvus]|uniref:hypothetical protein n=1 Tax=Campylobacter curvus TaxID=200 RepID=UPI0014701F44|nr:hypothetical protein [Campylobacter curvus]